MTQIAQIRLNLSLKMCDAPTYELRTPASEEDWHAYHSIRRKVLFENRGQFGVYEQNHPDEHREGNHPLLLTLNNEPIGVIRVDISCTLAIFRRVAIREDLQRSGHGRVLLALAESFASRVGCNKIRSEVASDAVGFYERCGYTLAQRGPVTGASISMQKNLG